MSVRARAAALGAIGAYALALRMSDGLFEAHVALMVRAYGALGRLSAASGAPVAEALALGLALACAGRLAAGLALSARRRSCAPAKRALAGIAALALALGGALLLMWPAWRPSSPRIQAAYQRAYGMDELERLILRLDGVLRAAEQGVDLSGPIMRLSASPEEMALRAAQAYRAAGYCAQPPKLARLPGAMARLRIAGIFVPLTGEAVVSPDDFDSALPFTMLHELAHAQGVLREDEANLTALEVALSSGDAELIWSSALTAQRYALNTLRALDKSRYLALRAELSPPALRELDAQRALEAAPRGCDMRLSAAAEAGLTPALAYQGGYFARVSGRGDYDGLTYLLLDALRGAP